MSKRSDEDADDDIEPEDLKKDKGNWLSVKRKGSHIMAKTREKVSKHLG